jgi:RNA polymerase sigma factor (TIGR02999 family)
MASEVTQLLDAIEEGDPHAAEELLPLVYEELRRLASVRMAAEKPGQTIQATALVHEAWLKIARDGSRHFNNRRHFFAVAAEAMRRILIDRARRRLRLRHGGGQQQLDLDENEIALPDDGNDDRRLQVHEALDALAAIDPLKAEVVKLRFFVGLTAPEAAEVLGLNERTVDRHWAYSKTWLFQRLKEQRNA